MNTGARCHHCAKLLGTADGTNHLEVFATACQAQPGEIVFAIKCPRCGKISFIKFYI